MKMAAGMARSVSYWSELKVCFTIRIILQVLNMAAAS